jgi:hypothetical protein
MACIYHHTFRQHEVDRLAIGSEVFGRLRNYIWHLIAEVRT